jgi:hypothetical protein
MVLPLGLKYCFYIQYTYSRECTQLDDEDSAPGGLAANRADSCNRKTGLLTKPTIELTGPLSGHELMNMMKACVALR